MNNAGSDEKAKEDQMKERFRVINDCFNSGNTEAIDTLLSANAKDHSKDPSMPMPDGPEGLKQLIGMMRAGAPDLKSEIKELVADGNILMAYGTMTGTNSAPMFAMPATNKSFSADWVDVIKFGDDMKMTDHWGVYDNYKMMMDLGVIPAPGGDTAMAH